PRAGQALFAARTGRLEAADQLTPREREVLLLVAEGLVNKQIARRLGISEKTTKAHLTRIYAAIGVSDRTQAALWAERNGRPQDDRTSLAHRPAGVPPQPSRGGTPLSSYDAVTALVTGQPGPGPTPLTAATVKVYVVPAVSPVTVPLVALSGNVTCLISVRLLFVQTVTT